MVVGDEPQISPFSVPCMPLYRCKFSLESFVVLEHDPVPALTCNLDCGVFIIFFAVGGELCILLKSFLALWKSARALLEDAKFLE